MGKVKHRKSSNNHTLQTTNNQIKRKLREEMCRQQEIEIAEQVYEQTKK